MSPKLEYSSYEFAYFICSFKMVHFLKSYQKIKSSQDLWECGDSIFGEKCCQNCCQWEYFSLNFFFFSFFSACVFIKRDPSEIFRRNLSVYLIYEICYSKGKYGIFCWFQETQTLLIFDAWKRIGETWLDTVCRLCYSELILCEC